METLEHLHPWLELMNRPAFCVKDGIVVAANAAAKSCMLQVGTHIREIVTDHKEEYESFSKGCLYLTISFLGTLCEASVTRTEDYDIFTLKQDTDNIQLQALALAAQQLRIPLSNTMTVADRLIESLDTKDASIQQQASQVSRGLFQLFRIIANMSDACSYHRSAPSGMQTVDLTALIREVIEKIQAAGTEIGISLQYHDLKTPVFGLANPEKIERAIYNLLSNAIKFSHENSAVEASLNRNGNTLSFSVSNTANDLNTVSFWNNYQRTPTVEDSRYGLGLGLELISAVATAHKGTVLVDHPSQNQIRVTMTISIMNDKSLSLQSPILRIGDYAGGRDKGLLELSEILPPEFY